MALLIRLLSWTCITLYAAHLGASGNRGIVNFNGWREYQAVGNRFKAVAHAAKNWGVLWEKAWHVEWLRAAAMHSPDGSGLGPGTTQCTGGNDCGVGGIEQTSDDWWLTSCAMLAQLVGSLEPRARKFEREKSDTIGKGLIFCGMAKVLLRITLCQFSHSKAVDVDMTGHHA